MFMRPPKVELGATGLVLEVHVGTGQTLGYMWGLPGTAGVSVEALTLWWGQRQRTPACILSGF